MIAYNLEQNYINDSDQFQETFLIKNSAVNEEISTHQSAMESEKTLTVEAKRNSDFSEDIFCDTPPQSKRRPKESNPNLLKNLIVTLRTWINFKGFPQNSMVRILWEHFKASSKINKQLLSMIYSDKQSNEKGFKEIAQILNIKIQEHSLEELRGAQQLIRKQTVTILEEADVDFVLRNRRVKNKEEFEKYFLGFFGQLKKMEGGTENSGQKI